MKFGDGSNAKKDGHLIVKETGDDDKKEVARENVNIGASFGAAGSVLTLSIHAKQENVIKMYLFCNGQCIRFMPEDVKTVLPILFNMEYGNNRDWIDSPAQNDAKDYD